MVLVTLRGHFLLYVNLNISKGVFILTVVTVVISILFILMKFYVE